MRIKLDYVTNSSSTSVVLWGVGIDSSNMSDVLLKKLFDKFLEDASEEDKEEYKTVEEYLEDNRFEMVELLGEVAGKEGLEYSSGYGGEDGWVGRSPFAIKDNETGLEFKQNIVDSLNKIGIPVTINELQAIQESWMDG